MRTTWKRSTSNATDRGVTLVEMVIVVAVFAALVLVILKTATLVEAGTTFTGYHNQVAMRCQGALNRLVGEVSASVRLYPEGGEARDLLGILAGVPNAMLPESLLPVVLPDGIVARDPPGQRATGNCLLFLQAVRPFTFQPPGAPERTRRIDRYRVACLFLRRKPGVLGNLQQRPDGLDLMLWRSVPLLDWAQVEGVDARDRQALLAQAHAGGIRLLFDTRKPILQALGEFDAQGNISPWPPSPYRIPADPEASKRFFAGTDLSVATNGAPPHYGVARFAQRQTAGQGFPHGLEVRLLGTASARQVVLHLTLVMYGKPARERAYADLTTLAVARDF